MKTTGQTLKTPNDKNVRKWFGKKYKNKTKKEMQAKSN